MTFEVSKYKTEEFDFQALLSRIYVWIICYPLQIIIAHIQWLGHRDMLDA